MSEITPKKKNDAVDNPKLQKVLTIVGIVLCVILIPILIINCTLIIKSFTNKEEVPGIAGFTPMIVASDSMDPVIKKNDIIIVREIAIEDIKKETIITFYDPDPNAKGSLLTHRVEEVRTSEKTGTLLFYTKGDNSNSVDPYPVPAEDVIGEYTGFRIPLVGKLAKQMENPVVLVISILIPLALLIGVDIIIRRRTADKSKQDDVALLRAELEALKAQKAKEETPEAKAETPEVNAETPKDVTDAPETEAEANTSEDKKTDESDTQ